MAAPPSASSMSDWFNQFGPFRPVDDDEFIDPYQPQHLDSICVIPRGITHLPLEAPNRTLKSSILVGAPGTGKTTLCRHLANHCYPRPSPDARDVRYLAVMYDHYEDLAGKVIRGHQEGAEVSLKLNDHAIIIMRSAIITLLKALQRNIGLRTIVLTPGTSYWWQALAAYMRTFLRDQDEAQFTPEMRQLVLPYLEQVESVNIARIDRLLLDFHEKLLEPLDLAGMILLVDRNTNADPFGDYASHQAFDQMLARFYGRLAAWNPRENHDLRRCFAMRMYLPEAVFTHIESAWGDSIRLNVEYLKWNATHLDEMLHERLAYHFEGQFRLNDLCEPDLHDVFADKMFACDQTPRGVLHLLRATIKAHLAQGSFGPLCLEDWQQVAGEQGCEPPVDQGGGPPTGPQGEDPLDFLARMQAAGAPPFPYYNDAREDYFIGDQPIGLPDDVLGPMFDILYKAGGRVVTYRAMEDRFDASLSRDNQHAYIRRIREALKQAASRAGVDAHRDGWIRTHRGKGYSLNLPAYGSDEDRP